MSGNESKKEAGPQWLGQGQPWGMPTYTGNIDLLAPNPGIWQMPAFLSEAETAKALLLVSPRGPAWKPCVGDAHDTQVGKICSEITLDSGPFAEELIARVQRVWDDPESGKRTSLDVFRYAPGHASTLLHRDF